MSPLDSFHYSYTSSLSQSIVHSPFKPSAPDPNITLAGHNCIPHLVDGFSTFAAPESDILCPLGEGFNLNTFPNVTINDPTCTDTLLTGSTLSMWPHAPDPPLPEQALSRALSSWHVDQHSSSLSFPSASRAPTSTKAPPKLPSPLSHSAPHLVLSDRQAVGRQHAPPACSPLSADVRIPTTTKDALQTPSMPLLGSSPWGGPEPGRRLSARLAQHRREQLALNPVDISSPLLTPDSAVSDLPSNEPFDNTTAEPSLVTVPSSPASPSRFQSILKSLESAPTGRGRPSKLRATLKGLLSSGVPIKSEPSTPSPQTLVPLAAQRFTPPQIVEASTSTHTSLDITTKPSRPAKRKRHQDYDDSDYSPGSQPKKPKRTKGKGPFSCTECKIAFSRLSDLNRHNKFSHVEWTPEVLEKECEVPIDSRSRLYCRAPGCDAMLARADSRRRHEQSCPFYRSKYGPPQQTVSTRRRRRGKSV